MNYGPAASACTLSAIQSALQPGQTILRETRRPDETILRETPTDPFRVGASAVVSVVTT